ncbi:three-Cys-motif partner protein TcmP [Sedimentibacter sp. MB35-C1]|uniref:three-Cys-motif partner protein TcmP n=1 Tax=Sedimentibacter sp. MB35-C1 TaxID=3070995 RepID=UPI0027DF697F|nr:three-Cys-motif partner protein TcmP [Sedimentibacter sp. MB35-C1]WMJ77862.1 three-Cys-motif partner protein TcmP [Sedimentibacter sp. MB35-C1]
MNCINFIDSFNIDKKILDNKKQQTEYKIKYVVEYIRLWLIISSERKNIKNINFIDCMCNAGVYEDGDLGTPIEVFLLFIESAKLHPNKKYNIFLNDKNYDRINIIVQLLNYLNKDNIHNLNIFISNDDVNVYLKKYDEFNKYLKYNASTVLFVDPYDFGTVVIDNMKNFLNSYYCELIFNFFSSDYVRNGIDARIRKCIGNVDIKNKDELIKFIEKSFRTGKIQHVFSYKFKTSTNTEIYQIIFATPSYKGLDVLKSSLWDVFNGRFNHRNFKKDESQLSIFTEEDDKNFLLETHANEAKSMLLSEYKGMTVPYSAILVFLAEKTMMKESQFLKSVVKPLVKEGKIKKCGNVSRKSNYKDDSYDFVKE